MVCVEIKEYIYCRRGFFLLLTNLEGYILVKKNPCGLWKKISFTIGKVYSDCPFGLFLLFKYLKQISNSCNDHSQSNILSLTYLHYTGHFWMVGLIWLCISPTFTTKWHNSRSLLCFQSTFFFILSP